MLEAQLSRVNIGIQRRLGNQQADQIVGQQMANHESARTTGLYDRRDDQLTLDEVERILI